MKSFWKRQSCLFAVVLAAGGAGALMGMASAVSAPPVVSRAINVVNFGPPPTGAQIFENADGTALTAVTAFLSPTVVLGFAHFANPDYTIWVQPGDSGQGAGTGHFELEGVFAINLMNPGMPVGPLDVSVDVAVAGATNGEAFLRKGISSQSNPATGEISIVRELVMGSQYSTGSPPGDPDAPVSVSISVDDGSEVQVIEATGGFGMVQSNFVHDVEQIQ